MTPALSHRFNVIFSRPNLEPYKAYLPTLCFGPEEIANTFLLELARKKHMVVELKSKPNTSFVKLKKIARKAQPGDLLIFIYKGAKAMKGKTEKFSSCSLVVYQIPIL